VSGAIEKRVHALHAIDTKLSSARLPADGAAGWWQASDIGSPSKIFGGKAGTFYNQVAASADITHVLIKLSTEPLDDFLHTTPALLDEEVDYRLSADDPDYVLQKAALDKIDPSLRDEVARQYGLEAKRKAARDALEAELRAP
jgi:hypothetical protein